MRVIVVEWTYFAAMRKLKWIIGAYLFLIGYTAHAQKDIVVGFYNLENLFDTINNEGVIDGEYTPSGSKKWTAKKYNNKLNNMSFVLNELGTEYAKKGAAFVGVCEVENRGVLEDLVQTGKLSKKKWAIIHEDSPDRRGIDVAMLYNPKLFKPILHSYHNANVVRDGERIKTRSILLVQGVLAKVDTVYVLVNHWPSRYGGQKESNPYRIQAAETNKHLIDSILKVNANAEIMVMGDLNDDPSNESVKEVLKTSKNASDEGLYMYNPFEEILANDEGSLKYRGEWNLFDQVLLSSGALGAGELVYKKAEVYNRCYLLQQKGKYSGYPHRTHGGKTYLNGYSDHLPVLVVFKKK